MQSIKIDVAPSIIDWVVNHAPAEKLTAEVLDDLNRWKHGEKEATFSKIESLSKATHIPLGYFFLQTPPKEELPVLQYRTVESISAGNPSRNLVDTIHHMESVQEWMRDYLVSLDNDELHFVGSQKNNGDVMSVTSSIRQVLQIPMDWYARTANIEDSFKLLRDRLDAAGVLVMTSGIVGSNTHRSLEINEFRAFTLIDGYAPLIFINANDSQGGKLFSLVHEAAHIWLGVGSFFNDRGGSSDVVDPTEIVCNAIAAEILVPSRLFSEMWHKNFFGDIDMAVEKLARILKCGVTVVARRALDNGFIRLPQYQSIATKAVEDFHTYKAKQAQGGGDYYATNAVRLDNRFLIALDNTRHKG